MQYVSPSSHLYKMEFFLIYAQTGASNLTASCSGSCSEAGYSGYPNYVSCLELGQGQSQTQFSVFLPGDDLASQASILAACDLDIGGTPLDESDCQSYISTACGGIGFTYFLSCDTTGSCPPEGSSVTLTCDGFSTEGPCDYSNPSIQ